MTDRESPVRIGVIGCADIAGRRTLPSLLRQPATELVAVASRTPAKASEFAARFGAAPVVGYQALLARDDVEAVYLPLPPDAHLEWVLAALAAGKHVLCEKPFAGTAAQARQAVTAAEAAGLVVMENFMFLHHHQHRRVTELVLDGRIGELRAISADFAIPAGSHGSVSTLPEVAGYPIRTAELFLGERLRVAGVTRQLQHGVAIGGSALLHADDGVSAQLGYGISHSYRNRYALWGSAGRLWLDRAYTPPDDYRPVIHLETAAGHEAIELAPDAAFVNALGAFAAAVRYGTGRAQAATDILNHAELTDAIL